MDKRWVEKVEQRVGKKRHFPLFDGVGTLIISLNIDKNNDMKRFGMENAVNCCQILLKR